MSSPEVSPAVEAHDLVAGIGNHEAKALLLIHLSRLPTLHARYPMGTGFKEFIGPGASWYPTNVVPFKYCEDSLEPIGQVIRGTVQSRRGPSKAYGITEFGQRVGVPAAGLISEWSLQNPEISVQRIFGSTQSRGEVRAPKNRISLLSELVTSPQPSLSISEIAGLGTADWESPRYQNELRMADDASRALALSGIVNIHRETEGNGRRFRIHGIDSPVSAASKRGPISSAIYDFICQRFAVGELEFTTEEVVDYVTNALRSIDGYQDPAYVRSSVHVTLGSPAAVDSTTQYRCFPNLERLELPFENNKHTKITFNEAYRAAIENLVGIVVDIDDRNLRTLEYGRKVAEEISADRTKKQSLIAKAYEFSAAAQKRSIAETMDAVVDILRKFDGPVDALTIYDAYAEAHPRPITQDTIMNVLRKLSAKNKIIQTKQRYKESSRKQRNFYSLAEE